MNLLGLRSAANEKRVTLDKINRALRLKARQVNATLKILQTQELAKAITFLQRNRNSADGCILAPGAWARNSYELLETIQLCGIPTVEIHFNKIFDPLEFREGSILSRACVSTEINEPMEAYSEGFISIINYLSKDL